MKPESGDFSDNLVTQPHSNLALFYCLASIRRKNNVFTLEDILLNHAQGELKHLFEQVLFNKFSLFQIELS